MKNVFRRFVFLLLLLGFAFESSAILYGAATKGANGEIREIEELVVRASRSLEVKIRDASI